MTTLVLTRWRQQRFGIRFGPMCPWVLPPAVDQHRPLSSLAGAAPSPLPPALVVGPENYGASTTGLLGSPTPNSPGLFCPSTLSHSAVGVEREADDDVQVTGWRQKPGTIAPMSVGGGSLRPNYAQKVGGEFLAVHPQTRWRWVSVTGWASCSQSPTGSNPAAASIATWRTSRMRDVGPFRGASDCGRLLPWTV